jgi:LemA protein
MNFLIVAIPAFVFLAGLIFVVLNYNSLIALRNHIREAWSNIDTELKRRYELIPNLVATVKGYAKHEQEVLERVTQLRNQCAGNNGNIADQAADERLLVTELRRLLVLVEDYPELKADQHFLDLQQQLVNTEDRIQAARRFYNGNVRDYKNKCEQFPSNLVAGMFGFKPESYFQVEPSVKEVPNLEF